MKYKLKPLQLKLGDPLTFSIDFLEHTSDFQASITFSQVYKTHSVGIYFRNWIKRNILVIFVCFDSLCPSQEFFSYVGTGLPGLNQYSARIKVSCSRTQHSVAGEA